LESRVYAALPHKPLSHVNAELLQTTKPLDLEAAPSCATTAHKHILFPRSKSGTVAWKMKRWSRKTKWFLTIGLLALLPLLWFSGLFAIGYFNLFGAHQHCSKSLSMSLRVYAGDNYGKFPFHTNGFGDALLILLKEGYVDARTLTAPGDDGTRFSQALTNQTDIDESECSRIYIQGLSEAETGGDAIALVFDAYPTPGGDHGRRPWGKPIRDVVLSDGSVDFVPESRWPAFATNQTELLVRLGLARTEMEKLFGVDSLGRRTK
jgi:hypothetical protein